MWRVQNDEDSEAFSQLVARWQTPIQSLCHRMLGDRHKAEDLAQEAFTRLFVRREAYQAGNKFSTYLFRIAINLCYDEMRRLKVRREAPLERDSKDDNHNPGLDLVDESTPAPDHEAHNRETGVAVRDALLTLPEQFRTIVVLRHYENLKFREIAEVLGLPEGTVKTHMTEALNMLARKLKSSLGRPAHLAPGTRTRPIELGAF